MYKRQGQSTVTASQHGLPEFTQRHGAASASKSSANTEERRAHALRLEPKLYPPNLVEEVLDNLFADMGETLDLAKHWTLWDNDEARRLADATEHAEGSASFRALTEYKLRKGKTLTIPQRSLINVILRQHLGDAKVASFLFNHDIPSLLDLPIQRAALTQTLLKNMLEELVNWHVSLLHSLPERQQHLDVIVARTLSNPSQEEWQRQRRSRTHI